MCNQKTLPDPNLPVVVFTYKFFLDNPAEKIAYENMCKELAERGYKKFACLGTPADKKTNWNTLFENNGKLVPPHIWENQFNASFPEAKKGVRVFDWYEPIYDNPNFKRGYYISPETKDRVGKYRGTLVKCGYCGVVEENHGQIFHAGCLGSEYLKPDELNLCLFRSVLTDKTNLEVMAEMFPSKEQLTAAAMSQITPVYEKAQAEAKEVYKKKQQERRNQKAADLVKDTEQTTTNLWYVCHVKSALLKSGLDVNNLIYYSHTNKWVWGWQENHELTPEQYEEIVSKSPPMDCQFFMKDGTVREYKVTK